MSHIFFQIFPKSMKWVYRILVRIKPKYYISDIYITYCWKYRCKYNLTTLLLNRNFMENLYKGMPITKLELVNKF